VAFVRVRTCRSLVGYVFIDKGITLRYSIVCSQLQTWDYQWVIVFTWIVYYPFICIRKYLLATSILLTVFGSKRDWDHYSIVFCDTQTGFPSGSKF